MQPTQPHERHLILDVLRGFALIGVLFANMPYHSGFWMLSPEAQANMQQAEAGHVLMWLLHFFSDGKFYSIFSMLFGIGFALQLQRSLDRNEPFAGRFSRRLLILFLFGLLHAVFFFVGDILTVYALLGFVLLLFTKVSDKGLLRWAIILLIIPVIQYAFMWYGQQTASIAEVTGAAGAPPFEQLILAYQSGSLKDILMFNAGGLVFGRYPDLIFTGRFFRVFAMFLLGFYVARKQFFVNIAAHRPLFKKVMMWGVVIGIPCNVVLAQLMTSEAYYSFAPLGIIQPIVYAYGVPALGLFYACGIALLYQKQIFKNILSVLAPFGRMALTNYIMQSIICCLIYNSYGLGLFGTDGPLAFTAVGLGILIFQLVFSHVWLTKFQYGPMEWLWRVITYRKMQPIKKNLGVANL
ncbi:membrane protein [Marivirga lumbricoides]|uniref:Membrane protein n=1 Tax=Marivirga lumbricoides TaxID=1046115 RepID=A0ABQ1LHA5_9BACT|nr:membrane protein [Marivirga lumbricoides]